jgi:hypothetical protein
MLGVFNQLDKKYNLKGETHTEHILDEILEDCSLASCKGDSNP